MPADFATTKTKDALRRLLSYPSILSALVRKRAHFPTAPQYPNHGIHGDKLSNGVLAMHIGVIGTFFSDRFSIASDNLLSMVGRAKKTDTPASSLT
jgi:hypothetical protein